MDAAVTEFTVVKVGLLGALTCQLGHTSHRLALTLALLDLVFQDFSHILMDMKIVVHFLLQEIAHIFIDGFSTIRSHRRTSELDFRLTFKDRFLYIDGNSRHQSVADVAILILAVELLDGLGNMLLESTLMSTSLGSMLTIDEGIVFLAILIGMGKGYLNILTLHVDNIIETLIGHIVAQKVLQTMTAEDTATIVHDGETCIQISIVAEHRLHDVIMETVVLEERIVWFKKDESTILILRLGSIVFQEITTFENKMAHLAVAERLHLEMGTEGIDRFHTDTVQTDTLLERLAIVLTTGIQHADSLNELSLRNTTAIVADADTQIVLYIDFQTCSSPHLKLIDGVIDHLLQEHINTILRQVTITQTTDVHTRTGTHMLHIAQMADIVICIFYRLLLRGICQFFSSTLFIQVFIFRHKFLRVILILFYTNSCYLLDFLNIAVAALVKDWV